MRRLRQVGVIAALLGLAIPASAYFHFLRYQSRFGPIQAIPERFDLAALPGSTVNWFLNDSVTPALAQGDSMTSLVSQVQAAARVWNDVSTSELRIGYGGTVQPRAAMNTPWIEVTFDEVPPGLVAMGGPVTRGEVVTTPVGSFVPIVKSQLILNKDLASRPSYTERFFLNIVHELGHALGLQHSWTSGAMSTEITRATTKASPLGADDIAGISVLYPSAAFRQRTGSIAGRVVLEGSGAHLASVVALSPAGPAISTLTLPDGTYRIDGIAPGNYFVYTHPLPPPLPGEPQPVNLVLPSDAAGTVNPAPFFDMQFYPGGRLPQTTVTVTAAAATENIDFNVTRRSAQTIHSVQTYSFYAQEAVKPAFLSKEKATGAAVFTGYGLVGTNGGPVNGLNVSVLGNLDPVQRVAAYSVDNRYLQVDLGLTPESAEGHRHLLLSVGNETHVVPSAIRIVPSAPPSISTVSVDTDRTARLTGTLLSSATSIWFDGVKTSARPQEDGAVRVTLPAASNLHSARVVATNPDGQSSLFLLGSGSPSVVFERSEAGGVALAPASMSAGTEGVVEITSPDGQFDANSLQVAFGTADVAVKRLFVVSPNRAWAQVAVSGSLLPTTLTPQVLNGLQTQRAPQFFVQPANARNAYVAFGSQPPVLTLGSAGTLSITNAPATFTLATSSLLLGDQPAAISGLANGTLTFQVPAGLPTGLTLARLTLNGETLPAAVVRLESPPPSIVAVQTVLGAPINSVNPATPGSLIQVLVPRTALPAGVMPRLTTTLGDGTVVEHIVLQVQTSFSNPALAAVYVSVAYGMKETQFPIVLTVGSASSAPFLLAHRP